MLTQENDQAVISVLPALKWVGITGGRVADLAAYPVRCRSCFCHRSPDRRLYLDHRHSVDDCR